METRELPRESDARHYPVWRVPIARDRQWGNFDAEMAQPSYSYLEFHQGPSTFGGVSVFCERPWMSEIVRLHEVFSEAEYHDARSHMHHLLQRRLQAFIDTTIQRTYLVLDYAWHATFDPLYYRQDVIAEAVIAFVGPIEYAINTTPLPKGQLALPFST